MVGDGTSDGALPRWIVLAGILLVSLNLRPSITSVSPLLEAIRADLTISYTAISLLTTIPVLCMGVFALLTPAVTRRFGREGGVFWAVALIAVATFGRIGSQSALVLFGTTLLIGVGIAISQTLLPPLVSVYYPDRVAFVTGLYTASLAVGASFGSAFTVSLRDLLGSWMAALAVWGALAVIAAVAWIPVLRADPAGTASGAADSPGEGASADGAEPIAEEVSAGGDSPPGEDVSADGDGRPADAEVGPGQGSLPLRSLIAWLLVLFLGGAGNLFYSGVTWLAPRYIALGWSEEAAGLLLTVFVVAQLVGMGLITVFGDRTVDRRGWVVVLSLPLIASVLGIAYAPESFPWVFAGAFGAGAGGLFTLALTLPVDFSASDAATEQVSSMVLAGGYTLAAVGPLAIGSVLDVGGTYALVFAGFAAITAGIIGISAYFDPQRPKIEVI